jgi:hypothetical protein
MDGEAEWSRVESPPGCIPTTPTTPTMPRYSPYYLLLLLHGCSSAADLEVGWAGWKKNRDLGQAGRTMSPSPALLDRYQVLSIDDLTRGAIAGIHHEASRLQPRPPPPHPPPPWQSSAQCALSRLRLRGRKVPRRFHASLPRFSPVGHSFTCWGEWEGGWWHTPGRISIDQDPAISSYRGERQRYLLFRTPRASSPVAAGRGERKGKKVVVPGWGCAARLHMHNAE